MMHLTGLLGMPRRVYVYPEAAGWTTLNLISSIGAFVMSVGFALVALDVILQIRFGQRVRRDIWKAGTLEWAMPTPPAVYGFASLPTVDRRADRLAVRPLARALAAGDGYLARARNGWQETLGVHMTSGAIDQLIVLPRATYLPLWTALAVCAAVLGMLFKAYLIAIAIFFIVMGLFVFAGQSAGLRRDYGSLDVGRGASAPPHTEVDGSPPWWAMVFALVADGTIFVSLAFGTAYLWLVAPNWPPPATLSTGLVAPALAAVALALGPLAARAALAANARSGAVSPWLALGGLSAAGAAAGLVALIAALPQPTAHAYAATSLSLLGYGCLHLFVAGLFTLSNAMRLRAGCISARRTLDLRLTRLWQDFTATTGLIALALTLAMPHLATIAAARP